MTVGELRARMTSRELTAWMAFLAGERAEEMDAEEMRRRLAAHARAASGE